MVNLSKNLRPFRNYIFKIQWKIHFLLFQILTKIIKNNLNSNYTALY